MCMQGQWVTFHSLQVHRPYWTILDSNVCHTVTHIMVIGFLSPLAYCTIFIVMSSEVVDLHICICIRTSHCLYLHTHRLHAAVVACCDAADLVFPPCRPVFTCLLPCDEESRDRRCDQTGGTISRRFSSPTLLNKDRQCCESWREVELGVHAVYAVGETTDENRWVDLLCCSPHCDTAESCLTNDTLTTFSLSSDFYDDWRQPSPTVRRPSYHASSPFRWCRLLSSCSNTSAAQCLLLAASYIFLVTFSVLYYVTDYLFPIVPLSISLDTVLSHNTILHLALKLYSGFKAVCDNFKISTQAKSYVMLCSYDDLCYIICTVMLQYK